MSPQRLLAVPFLALALAVPVAAQDSSGGGWDEIADGVRERRLEDGRMERIALGVAGWSWAVDRMQDEESLHGDLEAAASTTALGSDLSTEVLRLQWARDALDSFVAEYGEAEVEAALREARDDCSFSFTTDISAAGGLPSRWVYPFGIDGRGTAAWETGCGAEALVYARVEAKVGSPGISSVKAEEVDLCFRRGTGAACRAEARVTGFAPCSAEIFTAVAVPELALYFEAEEVSEDCAGIPNYPDPFRY